jgi:hypothetical protein
LIQAFDYGLHGDFSNLLDVLSNRGEVDERKSGNTAVVVPDNGYVTGNVNSSANKGDQDTMGTSIVTRKDCGRQRSIFDQLACGGRTRFLRVVTGQDTDLLTELMPSHGLSVSAPPVGGSRKLSPIHVDDRAVT